MDYLRQVENRLGAASRELRRATRGRDASYDYPDTTFGQSLRWTADMIETGSATRVYHVTIGSFETATSPSFDTHSQQREMHRILYSELGRGLLVRHAFEGGRRIWNNSRPAGSQSAWETPQT